eukprot:gnl/MRDRNA2_/MRDRNA2_120093_c0_seq1.p1 gnl/MRDRNA2_/MRDRNA2_120093_c0~~gnl/MRDRNA2_/MRDRNA2_120093_c0_seq1.p1  ORF type:complete len:375 (-),score=59.58 gnl/MRDRNA2_/MRDRNA2_120093_c0_seq1:424-1548(-)
MPAEAIDAKAMPQPSALSRAWKFYWDNYLPLMMIFVVFFGFLVPAPGKELDKPKIKISEDMGTIKITSSVCVFCIFLLSGLGLKTDSIKAALVQWKAILYAIGSINFLTGMVAFIMLELPFDPEELSVGLAIFCAMPTTLSSGVTLVDQAKGNVTLALLLTAGTNILGVFTIPFMLKVYLSLSTDIELSPLPMLVKLSMTILVPLAIGKALRNTPLGPFRLKYKKAFGNLSSTFLVCVPLMKVSSSEAEIKKLGIEYIFLMLLAAACLHLLYLAVNTVLTLPLGLGVAERKAVIILSSQKTLPVAVTVISFIDSGTWQQGIMVIPCIVCHLMQLVIDALFVNQWALRTEPGGVLGLGALPSPKTTEESNLKSEP